MKFYGNLAGFSFVELLWVATDRGGKAAPRHGTKKNGGLQLISWKLQWIFVIIVFLHADNGQLSNKREYVRAVKGT
jgi:hypothetical protein